MSSVLEVPRALPSTIIFICHPLVYDHGAIQKNAVCDMQCCQVLL